MDARLSLLVLAWSVTTVSCSNDLDLGTVIFANVLYRHGDRMPIATYPNDPYRNQSYWPAPFAELTNLGKHQQLLLGRWLRNRYSHLLSPLYTSHDIYVRSTDIDRTLMSAEANLAGLYPPMRSQIWDRIKWMPIPVHTIPETLDYVLSGKKYCARYKHELERVLTSPEIQQINKKNAKLYAYCSQHTGNRIATLEDVEHLFDTLYIESVYNKTLPQWTKFVFPDKLRPLAELSFTIDAYNKLLQRLKIGPLLGEMIDHMVKKSQNTLKPDRKIWMYSAHDQTVANLLMTLNLFHPHRPPYVATILIELRTNRENQYFVTVSYKNTTEEPMIMTLSGCATLCPLEKFISLMKDVVPENWEKECRLDVKECSYSISSTTLVAILLSCIPLILLLILLVIGLVYWRYRREHSQYYFRLTTDAI